MSDTKENQPTTEKKAEKKTAHPAKKKRSKKSGHWIMPLVILILVVIGGGYSAWLKYQQQQNRTDDKISLLSEQVDKLRRAQDYQSEDQQIQLNELSDKQKELKQNSVKIFLPLHLEFVLPGRLRQKRINSELRPLHRPLEMVRIISLSEDR